MPGYEITPVVTMTDDGREQVTDFDISSGNTTGRDGVYRGWQDDWTVDSEGRSHHAYENFQEAKEEYGSDAVEDEYWDNVLEADPIYSRALDWASNQFFTDEQAKEWDKMIENGTDEQIHEGLERIKNQYLEAGGDVMEEAPEGEPDSEDITEEEMEEVKSVAQELMETEPDLDSADSWDDSGREAMASGDETYSAICSMTASFHRGEISAGDAIDAILNNYPLKDVERCWKHMKQYQ